MVLYHSVNQTKKIGKIDVNGFHEEVGKSICKSLINNGWSYTENSEY